MDRPIHYFGNTFFSADILSGGISPASDSGVGIFQVSGYMITSDHLGVLLTFTLNGLWRVNGSWAGKQIKATFSVFFFPKKILNLSMYALIYRCTYIQVGFRF